MKREISKPKLVFTMFAVGITCYVLHKLLGSWPLAVIVSSFIVIVAFRPIPNAKNCPGWFWHKCNQKEVSATDKSVIIVDGQGDSAMLREIMDIAKKYGRGDDLFLLNLNTNDTSDLERLSAEDAERIMANVGTKLTLKMSVQESK